MVHIAFTFNQVHVLYSWLLLDFENFMRLCRGVIIGVGAIITKQTAITHHYNTDSGIV